MGKGWPGAPLIKKCLRKVQKSKRAMRASLAAWGPGAKPLVVVQGAKPPETPVHFNVDTAFPTQTYIRQIRH